nr:bifunctional diaminohydroxyphosphoribosylaminopyrimidine deaminase/5-amino-6-(5-phosphoribosylamino)uracil reductase RibD [uncultured Propionibacterium sp.]
MSPQTDRGAGQARPTVTPLEAQAMDLALQAAAEGVRGANPLVGAAVVSHGRVVAVGHHRGAGTPHAEIDALAAARRAGQDVRGATAVVTLEPCNHTGLTGPCSQALIDAGVSRVVYAMADPHAVAAGGAARLRGAGVETVEGLMAESSRELNERWLLATAQGRPYVTAKIAQSLDGCIAAADGTSRWITGETARRSGHDLRARADAILVGTGTVLADDPRLTARDDDGALLERQPLHVVMGMRPVPAGAALREGRWVQIAGHDPVGVLAELAGTGIGHVLVEGGPSITSAFIGADLVDTLVVHQAPLMLGPGARAAGALRVGTLGEAVRWRLDGPVRTLGEDLEITLRPASRRSADGRRTTDPQGGACSPES